MAVPGRRLGMGVKLPEGLEATGLVGVNEIPHGALRHADYARHVVARVAKTYQIERVPLPLHAGDADGYTALPREPSCPLRESESGSYGRPPRSRCETSKSPSSVIEQESLVQSLKNPARSGKENHQKLAARSITCRGQPLDHAISVDLDRQGVGRPVRQYFSITDSYPSSLIF